MDIQTCPECGGGLVDWVINDARFAGRGHKQVVGVRCSNPHCEYRREPAATS